MKKPATKAEKEHMGRVAELGCIVEESGQRCGRNAEIHHVYNGGIRASHFDVLALCPTHHRNGGFGEAVHNGKRTWEARYGTERELLKRVNRLLDR